MADLVQVEQVKAYTGTTHTTDDMLLSSLITTESAFILSWVNRAFVPASYTDLFSGGGGQEHLFRNYPVISVASVLIDGHTIPSAASIQDKGYIIFDDRLLLFGYQFAWGNYNCQVIYLAGQDVPADVQQACIELVAYRYKNRDSIGQSSKSLAGASTVYMTKDMPDHVKTILNPYRKVFPS